jgi:hypothetical protein
LSIKSDTHTANTRNHQVNTYKLCIIHFFVKEVVKEVKVEYYSERKECRDYPLVESTHFSVFPRKSHHNSEKYVRYAISYCSDGISEIPLTFLGLPSGSLFFEPSPISIKISKLEYKLGYQS